MSAALLARLGAATGPDRVLDALLDIACAQTRPEWAQDTGTLTPDGDCVRLSQTGTGWHPPRYTASLDLAAKLIPSGLYWMMGFGKMREAEPLGACVLMTPGDTDNQIAECEAATVPLAICMAALEARANG